MESSTACGEVSLSTMTKMLKEGFGRLQVQLEDLTVGMWQVQRRSEENPDRCSDDGSRQQCSDVVDVEMCSSSSDDRVEIECSEEWRWPDTQVGSSRKNERLTDSGADVEPACGKCEQRREGPGDDSEDSVGSELMEIFPEVQKIGVPYKGDSHKGIACVEFVNSDSERDSVEDEQDAKCEDRQLHMDYAGATEPDDDDVIEETELTMEMESEKLATGKKKK